MYRGSLRNKNRPRCQTYSLIPSDAINALLGILFTAANNYPGFPIWIYDASALLDDKRGYWGIENGLHQRLDVIALEDKSRVRTLNAAWNLAMFRRLSVSLAVHWIRHQRDPRQATLSGFYDAMKADRARRAFHLISAMHPTWLPDG